MTDLVPWSTISESEFNSLVNSLLTEEFTLGSYTAIAIDGRGGDGGVDVGQYRSDGSLVRVFQLKWFPQGFSNGFRPRRQQITSLFKTAAKLHPTDGR